MVSTYLIRSVTLNILSKKLLKKKYEGTNLIIGYDFVDKLEGVEMKFYSISYSLKKI